MTKMSIASNSTPPTASVEIEPHRFIGIFYIVHSALYLTPLILCLLVIAQKEQLKHSCYKFMFVMTIFDIINLCTAGILSGYYSYNGIQYCCGNEMSMRIVGHIALGLFFMYCVVCMLLAFNRFIDFYSDKLAGQLFGQRRTWYWFVIPFLYGAYIFTPWSTTIIYNSQYDVWIFTPDELGKKGVIIHTINNLTTAVVLFVLYAFISFILYNHYKISSNDISVPVRHISTAQIEVIVQSMVICSITVVACLAYVVVEHTTNFPPAFYKLTQIIWQFMHGSSGIIYLRFNRTIRVKVKRLIFPKKNQVHTSPRRSPNGSRHPLNQTGN